MTIMQNLYPLLKVELFPLGKGMDLYTEIQRFVITVDIMTNISLCFCF